MRTVGEVLKAERERKFYTLEEVEKATKIRIELQENGDWNIMRQGKFYLWELLDKF